ncbi:hypothetical protein C1H46_003397 [Malus baccata]|uniref:BTB domain-containing protein n=1 Tax=Malus baccata TaxID=106549 RepID=A0A540NIW1_MALBA|nr:hypothetical protein C1H46_003397 [Malus baccata]
MIFDMLVPMRMPISNVFSDLTVEIGASSFALHKFPLVSKSGRIRRLLLEAKDAKVSRIILAAVPGGPEGFELAAKFCYGVHVEITQSNVAMLRCVAHFLELTEELINAIANNACKEQLTSGLLKLDHNFTAKGAPNMEPETPADWWGKALTVLSLDFFQRILSAVKTKGLKQDMISKI